MVVPPARRSRARATAAASVLRAQRQRLHNALRQLDRDKELVRIEIVLVRLVDDPERSACSRCRVGYDAVDLPDLERGRIALTAYTDHKRGLSTCRLPHSSSRRFTLSSHMSMPCDSYQCTSALLMVLASPLAPSQQSPISREY